MSGRFEKAPLAYVIASIDTASIELKSEQYTELRQSLLSTMFKHKEAGQQKQIDLNFDDLSDYSEKKFNRHGFYSGDRRHMIVISEQGRIEFRTTDYKGSEDFFSNTFIALRKVLEAVPVLKELPIKQISFDYVDVIVPKSQRELQEYFKNPQASLPLSSVEAQASSDLVQIGSSKVTRIVHDKLKVEVEIEQLPQRLKKLIPQPLTEPDDKFVMPIFLSLDPDADSDRHYAIVWTKTSILPETQDIPLDIDTTRALMEEAHNTSKVTFNELINHSVCNVDWNWIE